MAKGEGVPVVVRALPNTDEITIYPVGDLHIGDPGARVDLFEKLVEQIKNNENEYLILLGDLVNNGIKSSLTNTYEETMPPSEQKRTAITMLRPVADKILGMVGGNHEYRTKKEVDQDISLDIALALGIENRYDPYHLIIDLLVGESRYVFYVFHGHSATRLPGGTVNAYQQVQLNIFGVDAYLHGHSHIPYAIPYTTYFYAPNNKQVQLKTFYDISVASWISWTGYAARKQMRPRPVVQVVLSLPSKQKDLKVFMRTLNN
jgi:predicted MPP superfamily phosphohydrolase